MMLVLGDYMKIAIWRGGFIWCWKWEFFRGWVGYLLHLQAFPQIVCLGEG